MGIVYFIQPATLLKTNRYKIGRSSLNDLSRLKAYLKNTRYISIIEVENDKYIESKLIKHFVKKYTLLAGNEYFIGDELEMLKDFNNIVYKELEKNNLVKSKQFTNSYKIIFEYSNNFNKEIKNDEEIKNNKKISWMQKYAYKNN